MLGNKKRVLDRYDTAVGRLQFGPSTTPPLAKSMTSFSCEADLMDVCCISIITIGLAGEPQKAGWWYKGNRNVACRVGYVC